jgi:hypothetical protein
MRWKDDDEWWVYSDLARVSHDLFQDIILAAAWLRKIYKKNLRITGNLWSELCPYCLQVLEFYCYTNLLSNKVMSISFY